MKTKIILTTVMVFSIVATVPGQFLHAAEKGKASRKHIAAVAKSGNDFAIDMYAQLAGKSKGNMFFSPASIQTALAMTYAGARGKTAEQMRKTLHLPFDDEQLHPAFAAMLKQLNTPRMAKERTLVWETTKSIEGPKGTFTAHGLSKIVWKDKPVYQLVISNALWGQKEYPFRKEFTQLVKANYDAGLNNVDFGKPAQARKTINDWVATKTKDKIKDLIPPRALTPDTRLVLTNAIYFKSNWANEFETGATKDGPFHLSAEKKITVPLMNMQERLEYMETDTLQAIEMPYKLHDLSMIVLLPKKVDGLAAVEKTLTAGNLAKWLKQLKGETVKVTFPKYKFTNQFRLAEVLKAMGMTDAFQDGQADFSGMTTAEKLFISAVIHKAFVAVDEEGTEAAAATAVPMIMGCAMRVPPKPKVFRADHPFLFLIRHNATGSILFMGRVTNPKEDTR
ncbi:MAG: serpin family protein [Phycisphaerae bacterium]|nr:serpin family protein [Phycisphaerae bacterium]